MCDFVDGECSSGFSLAPNPMGPGVRYQLQEKHLALAEYYAKREVIQVCVCVVLCSSVTGTLIALAHTAHIGL